MRVAQPALSTGHLGDLVVNTTTAGVQDDPAATASDGANRAVVVWTSDQDAATKRVFAQRIDGNGAKVGGEITVNVTSAGTQNNSDVAMAADGTFVVVWRGQGPSGSDVDGVYARRFNADGTPASGEFQVNTSTFASQDRPSIGMNRTTGDFVIAWGSNVSGDNIRFRRFSASGTALDVTEKTAPGGTNGSNLDVAMGTDGKFVVVWDNNTLEQGGTDASGYGVFAQRYNADGTTAGSALQINSTETGDQRQPRVAIDSSGGFTVVWNSAGQDGDDAQRDRHRVPHHAASHRSVRRQL